MKKTEFLACFALVGIAAILVTTAIRNDWFVHTRSDTIEDYEEDVAFFRDVRSGLCFSIDFHDTEIGYAVCREVEPLIDTRLDWIGAGLWYFKDMKHGICMAGASGRHVGNKISVPCRSVEHLLGPQVGRYRIDRRLRTP